MAQTSEEFWEELAVRAAAGDLTVYDLARCGERWMRQLGVHHHFFMGNSLWMTALHLTLFALALPYDYQSQRWRTQKVNIEEARAVLKVFEKRAIERLPVPYITGEATYLGRTFSVSPAVLVPRSIMHTRFMDFLKAVPWTNYRVLDLCAGSGCIGISLALLDPRIEVDLVDISEAALAVAQCNIQRHHMEGRVRTLQSDLFDKVQGPYDLIITNPPYVSEKTYARQCAEFKQEPALALCAGADGLALIDRILESAHAYLNPQGLLIAEVGYAAAVAVKKKYRHIPFQWFNYREKDAQEALLARFLRWLGYPDGVFLAKAGDLYPKRAFRS